MKLMSTTTANNGSITTGRIARLVGAEAWMIHSAIRRGRLEPPAKHGPLFLWTEADVERVRECMAAEGYIAAGPTTDRED